MLTILFFWTYCRCHVDFEVENLNIYLDYARIITVL